MVGEKVVRKKRDFIFKIEQCLLCYVMFFLMCVVRNCNFRGKRCSKSNWTSNEANGLRSPQLRVIKEIEGNYFIIVTSSSIPGDL